MTTELEIVYSLLNTLKAGEYNNDERLSERFLRNLLLVYRANSMRKIYKDGHIISDEVYQEFPINLLKRNDDDFSSTTPKTISLRHRYGFYIEKDGIEIPIVNSLEFNNSKRDVFECFRPKAKMNGNELIFYIGSYDETRVSTTSRYYNLYEKLSKESEDNNSIDLHFYGLLYNPSDDPNYNWEESIFPFPAEKLEELKAQILVREFQFIIRAKKDEIQNTRGDEIRYHDNDDVTENA